MASATLLKWKDHAYSDGIMGKANRDGSAMNCSMNMRAREGARMDESSISEGNINFASRDKVNKHKPCSGKSYRVRCFAYF